jgi:predicted ATPase
MRSDLPSGTVTFLFTDVEGSTRLLHELGAEAYAEALAGHRRVIREACAAEGGVEVDTQGDAFFFAFPTAPGALAAAAALTEELASGPIRVRVGLHTGTPLLGEEGYIGHDVHRAARIAAAAHGGQVVVSASTAALAEVELVDLGEHRFKDLSAAERVYQLGATSFPPLKSLYRTNLPIPATPFLGRERELAEVGELMTRDDVRLLTLTGPGGTGKTRLALQAAAEASDRYPDGVFWVPLAPLRDASIVLDHAGQAVGASGGLASHVGDRRMLLLLDNFEHVLDAAPAVGELLDECRNLDVVATSRELLQLRAEHAYAVPGLMDQDGVALFLARARALVPEIAEDASVHELCERLDNLPLALELAASRARHLTPEQLLARLGDRLDLLTGARDVDPRQRTLRATIAWSYDLLEPHEQLAFARLSAFAGGWTIEAADEVAGAGLDVLASLVDKSLVRRTGERFWMLETIREFAAERLEDSGQAEDVRRRLAEYLLALVGTLGFTVEGIESGAVQRHDLAIAEHHNVRAAIEWALEADPVLGLRIATGLENFWISYSPFEGRRMFDELVERASDAPPELQALATRCRGNHWAFTGERERGVRLYEESLEQYQRLGDHQGQAILRHRLGLNLYAAGQRERGREMLERTLAQSQERGFRVNEGMLWGSLGAIEYGEGNVERGLELIVHSASLAREAGFKWWEVNNLNSLARYTYELGRLAESERYSLEAISVARLMEDRRHIVQSLAQLAAVAARRGDVRRAGFFWGAIEAEEQRGPLAQRPRMAGWDEDREMFASVVFGNAGAELESGLRAGRVLTLEQTVDAALADA